MDFHQIPPGKTARALKLAADHMNAVGLSQGHTLDLRQQQAGTPARECRVSGLGALTIALGGEPLSGLAGDEFGRLQLDAALCAVRRHLGGLNLDEFEDEEARTAAEVMDVLRATAVRLEARDLRGCQALTLGTMHRRLKQQLEDAGLEYMVSCHVTPSVEVWAPGGRDRMRCLVSASVRGRHVLPSGRAHLHHRGFEASLTLGESAGEVVYLSHGSDGFDGFPSDTSQLVSALSERLHAQQAPGSAVFRVMSGNQVVSAFEVEGGPDDPETLCIERLGSDDVPSPLVGMEFAADGSLTVGHWPGGEEWRRALTLRPEQ